MREASMKKRIQQPQCHRAHVGFDCNQVKEGLGVCDYLKWTQRERGGQWGGPMIHSPGHWMIPFCCAWILSSLVPTPRDLAVAPTLASASPQSTLPVALPFAKKQ